MVHADSFRFFALRFFSIAALPALLIGLSSCSDDAEELEEGPIGVAKSAIVDGSLGSNVLQCDGDLYFNNVIAQNASDNPNCDWVEDANISPPSQASCLAGGVALCNAPNITSAPGGKGLWHGMRIVDGYGNKDQDIFKQGKENDTSGWKIQSGSVGSPKYDITQAFLAGGGDGDPATSKAYLYFGMMRAGNDGTTAFDYEFNQKPSNGKIPNRTFGDILFTFECSSAGANAFVFVWDGAQFKLGPTPKGVYSAINKAPIDGPPWGFVNDKGSWVMGKVPSYQFAEAVVPVGGDGVTLPGVSACGGHAFVQVRTRSSVSATSDLKDATPVVSFVFGKPTAKAEFVPRCDQAVDYHASAVDPDGIPMSNTTCEVSVRDAQGNVVKTAGPACDGTLALPPGIYNAEVKVYDPSAPGCEGTTTTTTVEVAPPVEITASMLGSCGLAFDYSASVLGGAGTPKIDWSFSGPGAVTANPSTPSGNATVAEPGHYTGTVTVTETRGALLCTQTKTVEADVVGAVNVKLVPVTQALACPMSSDAITFEAIAAGGSGNYTYQWSAPGCSSQSACTINLDDTSFCTNGTVEVTVSDAACPDKITAIGTYEKKTVVTASVL